MSPPECGRRFRSSTGASLLWERSCRGVRVGHWSDSRMLRRRTVRSRLDRNIPGSEGIPQLEERTAQRWKVAQQDTGEAVVCNPVHPFFCIGGDIEVGGKEAIAVEAREAISAKMRKAVSLKPKPLGSGSAYNPTIRSTRSMLLS